MFWLKLGVGSYVRTTPPDDKRLRQKASAHKVPDVSELQKKLAQFGYRLEITGIYDADIVV